MPKAKPFEGRQVKSIAATTINATDEPSALSPPRMVLAAPALQPAPSE
jgi:hypothetical protein